MSGGGEPTAINVIGASLGHGLAPAQTTNLQIVGNYIGLGYDGTTVLGSIGGGTGAGVTAVADVNYLIKDNKIAGWSGAGIFLGQDNAQGIVEGNETLNNLTGILVDGAATTVISDNQVNDGGQEGIFAWNSEDITIQDNNVQGAQHGINISSNSTATIIDNNFITGSTDYGIGAGGPDIVGLEITNNEIELGQDGINISGDADATIEGNTVFDNSGNGMELYSLTGMLQVLGNEIYSNGADGISVSSTAELFIHDNTIYSNTGFGIGAHDADAHFAAVTNVIYDNGELGISLLDTTPITNDTLDPDSGSNDLLNFPEYTAVQETSGNTEVDYTLDVPAGSFRVEFFSNSVADPSGHGEGEEYLGFQNVISTGSGEQSLSYTLSGVTGVQNLAMTATEIDNSSDGFGVTSEFGGVHPPVFDTSVSKILTNPQDVLAGGRANYHITYTNNGPDDADLSGFGFGGGNPLLYDFVPPDLINPSGYITEGPYPDTQMIDVGNPDLTCLYAAAPGASTFGITTDTTLGLVVCWLSNTDVVLHPDDSISADLSFEVAPDSDLVFTNYVMSGAPAGDPDLASIVAAYTSGDPIAYFDSRETPVNNFAVSAYPVVANPEDGVSSSGPLAGTGQSTLLLVGVISLLLLCAGTVLSRRTR